MVVHAPGSGSLKEAVNSSPRDSREFVGCWEADIYEVSFTMVVTVFFEQMSV